MGSRKHYLVAHEDFQGCSVWLKDGECVWDLTQWWPQCHQPGRCTERLSRFLTRWASRLQTLQTSLYPGIPLSTTSSVLKTPAEPSAILEACVDNRVFVAFICWALGGHRSGRESGRTWANRLCTGKCVRGFLHMLLGNVDMDVMFHLWWGGKWEPCMYRHGMLDLSLLCQRREMLEWSQFEHRWKQLAFSSGSGLSFLPTEPSRCHLADLITGAFLVSDPCRHATWMPTLYSLLAQVGNWLPSLVSKVASRDPTTLPHVPNTKVDKGVIHMWLETLATSGNFSSLPQMLRAQDVSSVTDLCSRIYKEFTQRLLIRLRIELQECQKITIATDKSKAGPASRS